MGNTKDIRVAVEAELRFDPMVDAAGITVNNIGGNVALNGTVPSYPQYLEAAAAARRVAGVTGVHNHLEVVLACGDERNDAPPPRPSRWRGTAPCRTPSRRPRAAAT